MHTHTDTYRYIPKNADTYRYIQMHTDTYRCIHTHTDTYVHTYIRIQIHTDTYMYIHVRAAPETEKSQTNMQRRGFYQLRGNKTTSQVYNKTTLSKWYNVNPQNMTFSHMTPMTSAKAKYQ